MQRLVARLALVVILFASRAAAQGGAELTGTWLEWRRGATSPQPVQLFVEAGDLTISWAGNRSGARLTGTTLSIPEVKMEGIVSGTTRVDFKDGTVWYRIPNLKGAWRAILTDGRLDANTADISQDRDRLFLYNGVGPASSRARGALVRDQIIVDEWGVKGYLSTNDEIRWSNGTKWVRGATLGAAVAAATPSAPTNLNVGGAAPATAPVNLSGTWNAYGADGGGSGGFASAEVTVQQSGAGFQATLALIDWSAPPNTPRKTERVAGMVVADGVRMSGQSAIAKFEDNGRLLRFPDGSFWVRKPAAAPPAPMPSPAPMAAPAPAPAAPAAPANLGRTATRVAAAPLGGGAPVALFIKVRPTEWVERGLPAQDDRFTFREVGRDDWSVYLRDDSRNVTIQLDLFQKKVYYSEGSGPRRELYAIVPPR
jgi:hypothetical protein